MYPNDLPLHQGTRVDQGRGRRGPRRHHRFRPAPARRHHLRRAPRRREGAGRPPVDRRRRIGQVRLRRLRPRPRRRHRRQRGAGPDGRPPQQGPPRPGLDRPDQDQGQEGPRRPCCRPATTRNSWRGSSTEAPAGLDKGFIHELSLSQRQRQEGDAGPDRRRLGRRAVLLHPRSGPAQAAPRSAAGPVGARARPDDRRDRTEERRRRPPVVPRRRGLRPLHPDGRRLPELPGRVRQPVHALPARGQPGHAPGHLRVPDAHLPAHRSGHRQRLAL